MSLIFKTWKLRRSAWVRMKPVLSFEMSKERAYRYKAFTIDKPAVNNANFEARPSSSSLRKSKNAIARIGKVRQVNIVYKAVVF